MAWFAYSLERTAAQTPYHLTLKETIHTDFAETLRRINTPEMGNEADFLTLLQNRVDTGNTYGVPEEPELGPELDTPVLLDNND